MKLIVRSCVIDWIEETLTIVDAEEKKHVVPLTRNIHVAMIGFPDREEKDMQAHDLGAFMGKGYIIEKIVLEDDVPETEVTKTVRALLERLPMEYPPAKFSKEAAGYLLMIDHTIIFQRASGEEAIKYTKNYVEARDGHPTLPVGVIYGLYD